MPTTTRTFKKGDTVYTRTGWSDQWNGPYTVTNVRAAGPREWRKADALYHVDDLTDDQRKQVLDQNAERARARHAEASRKARIKQAEERFLATHAEQLNAPPVFGPVTVRRSDSGATVGATCTEWRTRGAGALMELYQREDWHGVTIRQQAEYADGKYVYRWGIGLCGTTYTPAEAAIMAESIRVALATIPELGNPTPECGP
jgi:hypothetical protein